MLANEKFLYNNGSHRYKYHVVNRDRTFLTNEEISAGNPNLPNDRLPDRQYLQ